MEDLKVFVSQPMSSLTNEQIIKDREQAHKDLQKKFIDKNVIVIDNTQFYRPDNLKKTDYLSYDIAMMGEADYIYCIKDWYKHRGCLVELFIAKQYGIPILYEDDVLK